MRDIIHRTNLFGGLIVTSPLRQDRRRHPPGGHFVVYSLRMKIGIPAGHRRLRGRPLGRRAQASPAARRPGIVLPGLAPARLPARGLLSLRFLDRGGLAPRFHGRGLPGRPERHLDHRRSRPWPLFSSSLALVRTGPGGRRPDPVRPHGKPVRKDGRDPDDRPDRLVHDRPRGLADGRGRVLPGRLPRNRPGPRAWPSRPRIVLVYSAAGGLLGRGQDARRPGRPPRRRGHGDGRLPRLARLLERGRAAAAGSSGKASYFDVLAGADRNLLIAALFRPGLDDLAHRLAEDAGRPQRRGGPAGASRRRPPSRASSTPASSRPACSSCPLFPDGAARRPPGHGVRLRRSRLFPGRPRSS